MKKDRIGLVFGGGGGKGAYQIGVWKYLHQIGLDKDIQVVSGTSVGALNAVLFALGDYDIAEKIWTTEIEDKILSEHDFDKLKHNNTDSLFDCMLLNGFYSRDGLLEIIDKYIDLQAVRNNEKCIMATCKEVGGKGCTFILNGHSNEEIIKILLASSAIPFIFEPVEICGKYYEDGGMIDNVPIKPLKKEKCSKAIIVPLNGEKNLESGFNRIVVNPTRALGGIFTGTLDFSPDSVKELIRLGYEDGAFFYSESVAEVFAEKIETLDFSDVLQCYKKNPKIIKMYERKWLPIVLKKRKKSWWQINTCLYNKETEKNIVLHQWCAKKLAPQLNDVFGKKNMIVLS